MSLDHQTEILELLRDIKRSMGDQLALSVLRDRASVYWQMQSIEAGELRGMRALLDQYFTPELATSFQQLNDYELSRILAIQRLYEYLYFCHAQDAVLRESAAITGARLPNRPSFELWVQEICLLKEFTLIHERQGRYYPDFVHGWLNPIIYKQALEQQKLLKEKLEKTDEKTRILVENELETVRQCMRVVLSLASDRIFQEYQGIQGDSASLRERLNVVFAGRIPEERLRFCESLEDQDPAGEFWSLYFSGGQENA